jgi:hypothetical protein
LTIPRREFSDVRKIQILRHEKSFFDLRRMPDFTIKPAGKSFFDRCLDVMAELVQKRNKASSRFSSNLIFIGRAGLPERGGLLQRTQPRKQSQLARPQASEKGSLQELTR